MTEYSAHCEGLMKEGSIVGSVVNGGKYSPGHCHLRFQIVDNLSIRRMAQSIF